MSKYPIEYKENYLLRWIIIMICLIGLMILTIILKAHNGALDIAITSLFYDSSLPVGNRFFLEHEQPWEFLYEADYLLLSITAITGLILTLIGLIDKNKRIFLRYGLFILISAIVSDGIVVNAIFKNLWGRPRPRQTVLFPNSATPDNFPFFAVWDIAFEYSGRAKSFSAGHPCNLLIAIGIYFVFNHPEFIVHYFGEYKEWKIKILKGIKYGFLLLSIIGGFLMGIGRIVQGAHWASDVLWSFAFIYITTAIFYHNVFKIPENEKKIMKKL
ncbi:MAG: phosphatase PAP2 family protein [archaeon]|nr:phosphatase PAP2 family protein [archaeon]